MRRLKATLLYFAIVLGTGFMLGMVRVPFLVPRLGERNAELAGAVANVTGYPGDKPSGTLWYDTKQVAAVSPTKVHYDIDTAGGQSGAVVYVIRDGARVGVAVHAYGGATTNSGTRISEPVFQNLTNWKA